ncbi:MAG: RNA polymerase sigma factor [Pseudomonadota bacterium]
MDQRNSDDGSNCSLACSDAMAEPTETLVLAAQAGDADAFEQLLSDQYDTIYRFALHWTGVVADAEDIAQETCIKLARALPSYRFEASFSTWVYRVVVNCAKDYRRKGARHNAQETAGDGSDVTLDEASRSVESQVSVLETLFMLDELPDGIRETLLLVHAEGMTHEQAAKVLEIKESTVSWRLHEFRKRYRQALSDGVINHD